MFCVPLVEMVLSLILDKMGFDVFPKVRILSF